MTELWEYIDANSGKWIEDICRLVSWRSVTAERNNVVACAKKLEGRLAELCSVTKQISTDGAPLVFGEIRSKKEHAPTMLVYGHYDTQPSGDVEQWDSNPFQ